MDPREPVEETISVASLMEGAIVCGAVVLTAAAIATPDFGVKDLQKAAAPNR